MPVPVVALVGYTNAGKSTLFNALTQAGVVESARMFATLDPTLRPVTLPSRREVLLSDTVGFIRNLPTTLVSAFRATLEEVQRAAILLQVTDATSPTAAEQMAQVESVLRELDAADKPQIHVLNKIDLFDDQTRAQLKDTAESVHISAARATAPGPPAGRHRCASRPGPHCTRPSAGAAVEGKALAQLESRSVILSRDYVTNENGMSWWSWRWMRRSRCCAGFTGSCCPAVPLPGAPARTPRRKLRAPPNDPRRFRCGASRGEHFPSTWAAISVAMECGRKLNGPEVEERCHFLNLRPISIRIGSEAMGHMLARPGR